jgi:hypothetical protein
MKIELDLSDVSFNYLTELSKEYKTSPDEIISGLIIGFAMQPLIAKHKEQKKQTKKNENRANKLEKSNKK